MTQRMNYYTASPAGMKALGAAYAYVRQSGLPERLVDLVFLRVSQINGCAFCIDSHARDLLKAGMPVEQLVLVAAWADAGTLFTDEEKAALDWAETVTRLGEHGVSDQAWQAVCGAFGSKALADLTIAISLMNAYNRIAISFRATPQAAARVPAVSSPGG